MDPAEMGTRLEAKIEEAAHLFEVADSAAAQRLTALEERVLNLETRRGSRN